jgi:phosphofructokinase-like protein
MRLGICTGGGDCPGLNAVIRAVVRAAANRPTPIEVVGIEDGFDGLVKGSGVSLLRSEDCRGILSLGGTILGTTNRGNPFNYPVKAEDGTVSMQDVSDRVIENAREYGLDGLIVVGGDGTLAIARQLGQKGLPVVGVPKTIDNDLAATDYTFGFDTAVNVAMEALDRLKTTAESHDRMMVMEVMGRYAGWIALHAGVAGGAHAILIPEIPFQIEALKAHIRRRAQGGANHHLIVVAEGAIPEGGTYTHDAMIGASTGAMARLGGVALKVANELVDLNIETRTLVLGHLQRGGTPTYRDRMLGTAFGAHALHLAATEQWDRCVVLKGSAIVDEPLGEAVKGQKLVDPNGDVVRAARAIGVSFGV